MFKKNVSFGFVALALLLCSCNKTNNDPQLSPYENGVLITNEGAFQQNSGSISFYSKANKGITNSVFETENSGRALGDVVQSYTEFDFMGNLLGFIIVNNSNKIEIVNAKTLKGITTITTNVEQCRYAIGYGSNLFVSCWGGSTGSYIAIIDLNSYTVMKKISVPPGPEQLRIINDELYIACSGGFGTENKILVVNPTTYEIKQTINVGDAPLNILTDANNNLWVLCRGRYPDYTNALDKGSKAEMIRINPVTKQIEARIEIGSLQANKPEHIAINSSKNIFYFTLNGNLYSFTNTDTLIPATTPIIKKDFYGIGIDPYTNILYAADPLDYNRAGYVYRYELPNKKIDSLKVGIIPNGFYFK